VAPNPYQGSGDGPRSSGWGQDTREGSPAEGGLAGCLYSLFLHGRRHQGKPGRRWRAGRRGDRSLLVGLAYANAAASGVNAFVPSGLHCFPAWRVPAPLAYANVLILWDGRRYRRRSAERRPRRPGSPASRARPTRKRWRGRDGHERGSPKQLHGRVAGVQVGVEKVELQCIADFANIVWSEGRGPSRRLSAGRSAGCTRSSRRSHRFAWMSQEVFLLAPFGAAQPEVDHAGQLGTR